MTGIEFTGAAPATVATVTSTSIQSMTGDGVTGSTVALTMTGGNVQSSNRGLFANGGSWTLQRVEFLHNTTLAVEIKGSSEAAAPTLRMNSCEAIASGDGILLSDFAVADLGTAERPGNNTFIVSRSVHLNLAGTSGAALVTAVGNTWYKNKQGSDSLGRYPQPATITGPVSMVPGNNFALAAGWTLVR